jgi:serine phosphatase RsbU (regulator of sigma subunit)
MFKKLSFRLSLAIIFVTMVVLVFFTIYLVHDRSEQMQKIIRDKGITCAKTGATMMGKMFDTIIDNGFFTLSEVFDSTLVPIEFPEKIVNGYVNISLDQLSAVQKYHYATGLDSYLDNAILEIQDQFLEDPQVIYAAMLDAQGYLPTHNSIYSQKLTSGFAHDLKFNRTKRIYRDETAVKASRNQDKSYLMEIYHRDTGEVMWDFSSPVFVKGIHWGVFRIGFSMEDTQKALHALRWKIIFMMGTLSIILVLIVGQITNMMMAPLHHLRDGVRRVAKGDLTYQQVITSNDEVGDLARAFNKMVSDLRTYIQNLTETTAAKEKIESELKIAHDIQMGILPKIFPPYPERKELDIHAAITPAREVGGDFYDFFFIDDDHFCFTIGDVSGKGVPASLLMAVVTTLLRAKTVKGMTPDQILSRVNIDLCIESKNHMFVTVFLGILNTQNGKLAYSNGGHNIPYILRRDGSVELLENTTTLALGVNDDFHFQTKSIVLHKTDGIFLYTDGVTEAMDKNKELFSEERLENLLKIACKLPSVEIDRRTEKEIKRFTSGEPQSDDITMITLKYLGVKES